jgi:hypothetical protein
MSTRNSSALSPASANAIARPIPLAAPVTSAALPHFLGEPESAPDQIRGMLGMKTCSFSELNVAGQVATIGTQLLSAVAFAKSLS